MRQQTPATMTGFERYTKKARSAIFLKEIGQFVSWRELCAVIEAVYPKAGNGRRPVGLERMLRIYLSVFLALPSARMGMVHE
jgi:transposase, IS5 family